MGTISTVIHIRYNSTILLFIAFDSNDKKLRCVEKKNKLQFTCMRNMYFNHFRENIEKYKKENLPNNFNFEFNFQT